MRTCPPWISPTDEFLTSTTSPVREALKSSAASSNGLPDCLFWDSSVISCLPALSFAQRRKARRVVYPTGRGGVNFAALEKRCDTICL